MGVCFLIDKNFPPFKQFLVEQKHLVNHIELGGNGSIDTKFLLLAINKESR